MRFLCGNARKKISVARIITGGCLGAKNKEYVLFLVQPLVERRTEVFAYVRDYYRAVSKPTLDETELPVFKL